MDNDTTILLFSKRAKDSAISRLKDIDLFEGILIHLILILIIILILVIILIYRDRFC